MIYHFCHVLWYIPLGLPRDATATIVYPLVYHALALLGLSRDTTKRQSIWSIMPQTLLGLPRDTTLKQSLWSTIAR